MAFTANTAAGHPMCLYQFCTSRKQTSLFVFFPFFSSLLCLLTGISGLWLGQSNITCFQHPIMSLAKCLALLWCWRVNLSPSLKTLAVFKRFSRISMPLVPFIMPSTLSSFSGLDKDKHHTASHHHHHVLNWRWCVQGLTLHPHHLLSDACCVSYQVCGELQLATRIR